MTPPINPGHALYCARQVAIWHNRQGHLPRWLAEHLRRCEQAASRPGHETGTAAEQSEPVRISAREAATILGVSKRHTIRLAADLDGQLVGGRWLFNPTIVTTYATAKENP